VKIVTLLTDFGTDDEYVGVMKGVILSLHPEAAIVDITHSISPQDVVQAAFSLEAAYLYFPAGTVHLVVVDPGVGTERSIIALKARDQFFVAPDNGVLSRIIKSEMPSTLVRVENSAYFLDTVSQTFHGRDIIAPVGAHISTGTDLNQLGAILQANELLTLKNIDCVVNAGGEIMGKVISIDRFGNLITNIHCHNLQAHCPDKKPAEIEIAIRDDVIKGVSKTYAAADAHSPVAVIGSRGYLEIAVSMGNARQYFNVEKGASIRVRC